MNDDHRVFYAGVRVSGGAESLCKRNSLHASLFRVRFGKLQLQWADSIAGPEMASVGFHFVESNFARIRTVHSNSPITSRTLNSESRSIRFVRRNSRT